MRKIPIILLFFVPASLFAQQGPASDKMPRYHIRLITMNDNMIKGLLLGFKDSSIMIYPGKKKEWKSRTYYPPADFHYTNLREVTLRRNNRTAKGMLTGLGIGTAIFAGSLFIPNQMSTGKQHHIFYTVFAIPAGMITGAIIGSWKKKTFRIEGNKQLFDDFKKRIQ